MKGIKTIKEFIDNNEGFKEIKKISILDPNLRMHNHLENNWNLSNKKALFYNMKAYYESFKDDYSKYLPRIGFVKSDLPHPKWSE